MPITEHGRGEVLRQFADKHNLDFDVLCSTVESALSECINYIPLFQYAERHQVNYNALCSTVRSAVGLDNKLREDHELVPRAALKWMDSNDLRRFRGHAPRPPT